MSPDDRTALLSHIAHELRTPLSVALGYTRMLAGGRYGALTEKQAQAMAATERCCAQIGELAEQLSLLAKLERGELTLRRGPIPLDALFSSLVEQHEPLPDHPVRVEAAPLATELTVHADAPHLRRAVATLLAAVIRTAPDESTVILAARPPAPSAGDAAGHASNAGAPMPIGSRIVTSSSPAAVIGIALASQLDALFDEDERNLEPLNDYEGGLGLGIALARQTIAAFGGRAAGRRVNGMMAVRLRLPLSPAVAPAPAPPSSSSASSAHSS